MRSREEERASLLTRDERARERATGAVRSTRSIDDVADHAAMMARLFSPFPLAVLSLAAAFLSTFNPR